MNLDKLTPGALTALRVAAILAGAFLATRILNRVIHGLWLFFVRSRKGRPDLELEKQANTLAGILRKTATVLVYALAGVMALRELGFDVAPLLAGAGVIGIAIGFGAQNLVRDVIGGFFLLVENQIRVNDVVVINDVPGAVEEINLRTTVLRDMEGAVHVFPNGSIVKLANRSRDYSYYVFSLLISWRDDADRVLDVLRQVSAEVSAEDQFQGIVLAPLEVIGVDHLGESHVTIKARVKTLPGRQWEAGREMNRRIKVRLEQAGFEFPVKGPRRIEILATGMTREDLKMLIQEVLEETEGDGGKRKSAGG